MPIEGRLVPRDAAMSTLLSADSGHGASLLSMPSAHPAPEPFTGLEPSADGAHRSENLRLAPQPRASQQLAV